MTRKTWLGLVACTCSSATLDAEFRNGVGSLQSFDMWLDCVTISNPAQGEEPD